MVSRALDISFGPCLPKANLVRPAEGNNAMPGIGTGTDGEPHKKSTSDYGAKMEMMILDEDDSEVRPLVNGDVLSRGDEGSCNALPWQVLGMSITYKHDHILCGFCTLAWS